ncbi:MAG: hypothetical protein ACI91B_003231, partial [Planctomycetota bacterium]
MRILRAKLRARTGANAGAALQVADLPRNGARADNLLEG